MGYTKEALELIRMLNLDTFEQHSAKEQWEIIESSHKLLEELGMSTPEEYRALKEKYKHVAT